VRGGRAGGGGGGVHNNTLEYVTQQFVMKHGVTQFNLGEKNTFFWKTKKNEQFNSQFTISKLH
jgi:hypothetical protein